MVGPAGSNVADKMHIFLIFFTVVHSALKK